MILSADVSNAAVGCAVLATAAAGLVGPRCGRVWSPGASRTPGGTSAYAFIFNRPALPGDPLPSRSPSLSVRTGAGGGGDAAAAVGGVGGVGGEAMLEMDMACSRMSSEPLRNPFAVLPGIVPAHGCQ
jgi:hypothetical protein